MKLEHIKNFMSVTSKLATAGQPSESQLKEIHDAGFEAALIQSLGLEYYHIPVNFKTPNGYS